MYKKILLNGFCALLLLITVFLSWTQLTASTGILQNDYKTFYRSLRNSHDIYAMLYYVRIHPDAQTGLPKQIPPHAQLHNAVNLNTPALNMILKCLVKASNNLSINTFIWTAISLLGAAFSVFLAMRYVNNAYIKIVYFVPFLSMLWISWPSISNQSLGQVSFLLLPFLMLGFVLQNTKYSKIAAVILGLLASAKLFFLLFLFFFLLEKQYKLLMIFLVSFVCFSFLPLLIFPWHAYQAFFGILQDPMIVLRRSLIPINGSLTSVAIMVARFAHPTELLQVFHVVYYVLALLVFFMWVIYYQSFLKKLSHYRRELTFAFIVMLSLMLSPLGWLYYYLFLLVPVVVIIKIGKKYQLPSSFYIFFYLGLLFPILGSIKGNHLFYMMIRNSATFLGLVFFLIATHVAALAVRSGKQSVSALRNKIFAVLGGYSAIVFVLLLVRFGFPFYLDFNKQNYLKLNPRGVWVNVVRSKH